MRFMVLAVFLPLMMISCKHTLEQDINNSNSTKKSQFEGEWYFRAALVDKQSHSSLGFSGMECPVERVRFEIIKDKLLAFRSYEKSSTKENNTRKQNLVAAFSIIKHFDNDNLENDQDGLWHEREFIKVDWSQNLVPHLECNQWLSSITAKNISNNESINPSDPFRVRIKDDYIESTVDAIVQPDSHTCQSLGEWNCLPAEYRVKYSFKKIGLESDYQERHYPDVDPIHYGKNGSKFCLEGDDGCLDVKELWLFSDSQRSNQICDPLHDRLEDCIQESVKLNSQFGFFRTQIASYDHKDGFTRRGIKQLINRWNIWTNTRDESGTVLALSQRMPKKITYYLNPGVPSELMPAIKNVEREWNIAFANIVAKLKNKCTKENIISAIEKNDLKPMLAQKGINEILPERLAEICSLIYEKTKNGNADQVFFSGDPHEIIKSYGNIFEIKINDCNAENIKNYEEKHGLQNILAEHNIPIINDDNMEKACAVLEWESEKKNIEPRFSWQQLGDLRYSFVNIIAKPESVGLLGYGPSGVDPKTGEIFSANANIYMAAITKYATNSVMLMDEIDDLRSKNEPESSVDNSVSNSPDNFSNFVRNTISSMSESTFKSGKSNRFLENNFAKIASLKIFPNSGSQSTNKNEISQVMTMAFGLNNEVEIAAKNREKEDFFSERSACFLQASLELPYLDMQKNLVGKSFLERVSYLKSVIMQSVLMHELGHTFGLRHNFRGSYDALNYPPNFWDVDTNDYRMRNGLAKEELRSSSIMDYHRYFNSDFSGLGLYDYAALLAGYGGKIEIFDNSQNNFAHRGLVARLALMNYQDFPAILSGANTNEIINRHLAETEDEYRRGNKSAHADISSLKLVKKPENLFKRSVIDYKELKRQKLNSIFSQSGEKFVQVPYAFCTDAEARKSDITCQPYSYGSTPSEIVASAIKDYELALALRSQGYDLLPTNIPSYLSSVYSKVYSVIMRSYQRMYMYGDSDLNIYPGIHDLTVSTHKGLEFISKILQAVEPGDYCKDEIGNYALKSSQNDCEDPIKIDEQIGKSFKSSFSKSLVGSSNNLGFFYDKIMALLVLIDEHASIEHEFSSWQKSNYSIGFYRVFTSQLINIFSSIYTNRLENIAPKIEVGTDGKAKIIYSNLFDKIAEDGTIKTKILPSSSPMFRDYAIIFSMAGLSSHSDHKLDFAKRAQISIVRPNSLLGTDERLSQIVFKNPNTGISYKAILPTGEESSPGFLMLKDAYQFVCDGQKENEQQGPWFKAKSQLNNVLVSASTVLPGVIDESEHRVREARKNFEEKNRTLNEKIRAIELVKTLSDFFVN